MLTAKLMELYDRVKQNKDIEAAELENLEECPFCEYKVVIDNENEKLFRCENEDCGAVTCRGCKKLVSVHCCAVAKAMLIPRLGSSAQELQRSASFIFYDILIFSCQSTWRRGRR
jgi:NAD-dependent DNA ligase